MRDRAEIAAIAIGGAAGALARVGLGEALAAGPGQWPWATFIANLAGALLLGWLITMLQEQLPVTTIPRPLIGTGLCGALTTFSTLQVEILTMLRGGHVALALIYLCASVTGGLVCIMAASQASRRVRALR